MNNKKNAIFAGSFDPFTLGHVEVVSAAREVFDEVLVAVANDTGKNTKPIEARCEMVKLSLQNISGITVKPFSGLLTDFAKREGISHIIRGLRDANDFANEQNLAAVYKTQNPQISLIYFITSHKTKYISSTIVRELARLTGKLDKFVAVKILPLVKKLYGV